MLHIKFLFHTHVNLARMFSGHGGFSVWFDMLLCNIYIALWWVQLLNMLLPKY